MARKKYKQDYEDRLHEHEGMEHMKRHHKGAMEASHRAHRRAHDEVETRGESEREGRVWGHGEFANMPKEERMESYPKVRRGREKALNDTISGIDDWSDQMLSKRDRYISDQH